MVVETSESGEHHLLALPSGGGERGGGGGVPGSVVTRRGSGSGRGWGDGVRRCLV